jgi:uncharacterized membrane protein YvbJ
VICPKCLTIETEGSLICRKCGAQLYTGLFQRPIDRTTNEQADKEKANKTISRKAGLIAIGVFAVSVIVLVIVLAILEIYIQ